jgi:hypothetical protein
MKFRNRSSSENQSESTRQQLHMDKEMQEEIVRLGEQNQPDLIPHAQQRLTSLRNYFEARDKELIESEKRKAQQKGKRVLRAGIFGTAGVIIAEAVEPGNSRFDATLAGLFGAAVIGSGIVMHRNAQTERPVQSSQEVAFIDSRLQILQKSQEVES